MKILCDKKIPEIELSKHMLMVREYAQELYKKLFHVDFNISVDFVKDAQIIKNKQLKPADVLAFFEVCPNKKGRRAVKGLTFDVSCLQKTFKKDFFRHVASEEMNRLLIHEFAHTWGTYHKTLRFYDSLWNVSSNFIELAIREPNFFAKYRRKA